MRENDRFVGEKSELCGGGKRGYCSQMILDSLKLWYIDLSMRKKITNLLSYTYARTEGFLFCIS